MEVLFETSPSDGIYEGKTANYITVHATADENVCGKFKKVLLEKSENGIMFGKTID